MSLQSDKIVATDELKKKQNQLLYLDNLTKVCTGRENKSNPVEI